MVYQIDFSHDGKLIASGSGDNTARIWDVSTGKEIHRLVGHTWNVNSVKFSHDGTLVGSGAADGTTKLWDVSTGKEVWSVKGHSRGTKSVAFTHNSTILASASPFDHNILFLDVKTGEELGLLAGHGRDINVMTFSPDGKYLASGSEDYSVIIWDLSNGHMLTQRSLGKTGYMRSVDFTNDGKYLAITDAIFWYFHCYQLEVTF